MDLHWECYTGQASQWPQSGRHILAQHDAESIVVYQAYRSSIARYAVKHGRFGGEFSFNRMTWVKPNFLWMMYRSGWGTKPDQENTLAIHLRLQYFEELLQAAVPSSYDPLVHSSHNEWKEAVSKSTVRLQWDPDHDPSGIPLLRRAVQIGIRGTQLGRLNKDGILRITDITADVTDQRRLVEARIIDSLRTPTERSYLPVDSRLRSRLGLADSSSIDPDPVGSDT